MVVNVTFSRTSGGLAIADILEGSENGLKHGAVANGEETIKESIYIRHDGDNEITDCKFYCEQFSGSYGGNSSASLDFDELKEWGGSNASKGFLIDVNNDSVYEYNLKVGQMDEEANAVSLDDSGAGGSNPDDIGVGGEAHINVKVAVPSTVDIAGIRQFDMIFKYSYTS